MDAYSAYAYSTGAWLSLQALPLSLFPQLMVAMLSPETRAPTGKVPRPCKAPVLQLKLKPFYRLRGLLLPYPRFHCLQPRPTQHPPLRRPTAQQSHKRSRILSLQMVCRRRNELLPRWELYLCVYEIHGDRLGMFCIGNGGEWISSVLWGLDFAVWRR